MAVGYIEKRGENSFRLIASMGSDELGRRKRRIKTFKGSRKEAEKELARFVVETEKQKSLLYSSMSVSELYKYWKVHYADTNLAETTRAVYDHTFPRIDEALGHIKIDRLQARHIQLFIANLSEPGVKKVQKGKKFESDKNARLSSASVRKHVELLSCIFSKAVRWGFVEENPCMRVDMPKPNYKPKYIYDPATLQKFLGKIENEETKHKLWVLLAFTGGLRREEIFGLEWQHVDFENMSIRVIQACVYTKKTGVMLKTTKTNSSKRVVSLPKTVMDLLQKHLEEQNEERKQLENKWIESNRVFTRWNGLPAHPHSFTSWLSDFCNKQDFPPTSPHTLRHMAATYLIKNGTDIRTVSGKLGHSRSSVTLDIYSHLLYETERKTADTMERILQDFDDKK